MKVLKRILISEPDGRGAQGSVILGGYDENRMIRNEVVFPFHEDVELVHTVWVESINWVDKLKGNISFDVSQTNYTSHIDSTRPFIYLPPVIYDKLSENLDLQYDNQTKSLIVPDEKQMEFKIRDPIMSFTVTPLNRDKIPNKSVTIQIPYSSLLLKMDYPIAKKNQSVRYVPIRKASDSSQYVLGRTFLQNAYIVSDYERGSFSIHQAKLQEGIASDPLIRPILTKNTNLGTLDSWKSAKKSLSKQALAGIVTGAIILTLLLFSIIFWLIYKRRQKQRIKQTSNMEKPQIEELPNESVRYEADDTDKPQLFEADSGEVYESPDTTVSSSGETRIVHQILEMPDTSTGSTRTYESHSVPLRG